MSIVDKDKLIIIANMYFLRRDILHNNIVVDLPKPHTPADVVRIKPQVLSIFY